MVTTTEVNIDKISLQIQEDFKFLMEENNVLGIILFGSYVQGENLSSSDVDLCLVMKSGDIKNIFKKITDRIDINKKKYDILFFSEMPWYLKGDIIDYGIPVLSRDKPTLYEFLYPYRKIWEDQKYHQTISKEEMDFILEK